MPPEIVEWHYDEVHLFFRSGRAAMVADWPGYYGWYKNPVQTRVADRFALAPCPVGPTGKLLCYAGAHTFALTRRGLEKPEAASLLRFLVAPEQQLLEARAGSARPPFGYGPDARRVIAHRTSSLALAGDCHRNGILVPPKFGTYPEVEEGMWRTVQQAMVGQVPIHDALCCISAQIRAIARRSNEC